MAKDDVCNDEYEIDLHISPVKTSIPIKITTTDVVTECNNDAGRHKENIKDINYFNRWTVPQLQEYLVEHGVNKSGNKQKLVDNVYGTHLLNLPICNTDPQQELYEIEQNVENKLFLENGLVKLPNPLKITDGWLPAPVNFPDMTYDMLIDYFKKNDAGKAYNNGKSLMESGHVTNVMSNMLSPNLRYCFIRCQCFPEQKLSNSPYDVWVCIHKDTGEVICSNCSCTAG